MTLRARIVATAASVALPPAFRTSIPASTASRPPAATAPSWPVPCQPARLATAPADDRAVAVPASCSLAEAACAADRDRQYNESGAVCHRRPRGGADVPKAT